MTFENLKKVVLSGAKGSFRSVLWERPMKTKKAFSNCVITKRTSAVVRFGVDYNNIKAVQEKRSNGELPNVNAGLPWGQWKMFPYFIEHKGNMYLRCAISPKNKMQTEYFLNGRKVEKSVIEGMVLASELKGKENVDIFILGAYGCGAFHNPPEIIASLFKELLNEYHFDTVEFAVYCYNDDKFSNYNVFKNILEN